MSRKQTGPARPAKARTSGQSTSGADAAVSRKPSAKTADLAPDTQAPGPLMTGNQGVAIADDQNSLRAGLRGPTLMEDFHLRERSLISITNA